MQSFGATNVKPKLEALTGLRFFAAIWVVIYHMGSSALSGTPLFGVFDTGYAAVGLFFLLSGFVLAYNYAGRASRLRRFYVARFARIYPLYAVGLLLSFPVFYSKVIAPGNSSTAKLALATVPTLLQAWYPSNALLWNSPGWSLSAEAFFYLVFPLLVPIAFLMKPKHCVAGIAVLWLLALTPSLIFCVTNPDGLASLIGPHPISWKSPESHSWIRLMNYVPIFRLPEFAAGVVLGCFYLQRVSHGGLYSAASSAIGFVAASAVALAVLILHDRIPYPVLHNGLLLPVWCLMILALTANNIWSRLLSSRPLILLGEASYGIYILQEPISSIFKLLLLKVVHLKITGTYPNLFLLAAYVVTLCVVCVAAYQWIEIPAQAFLKDRLSPRTSAEKSSLVAVSKN